MVIPAFPSLEQAKEIAARGVYQMIPLRREILADIRTPLEALRILKEVNRHVFLLESAEDAQRWGRYTFLGFDPTLGIACQNGQVTLSVDTDIQLKNADPRETIQNILARHHAPKLEGMPPFCGGLVGYFAYDYFKYSEPTLKLDADDPGSFKDVDLMLFDKVICFDHYRQKIILIANMRTENPEVDYNCAVLALDEMESLLCNHEPCPAAPGHLTSAIRPLFDRESYCAMVETAKHHIREGDIFQVVLSNRLEADFEGSLLNAYRMLRTINPSPYLFYFSSDDMEFAGASPETLVKLTDGALYTFPLAGTRPRGQTPQEDRQLEEELLADEKELAEHNMLVDLGRNDLGKISEFGSVAVESYHQVLRYSHVMHIGSTIRGNIRADKTALDAVDAVLPAGTLSGAPKLRACEIINRLENSKRGLYGGAIGYLDFTGNLDTCIAIRLVFHKNGKVFVRSGAGIVADSVPEKEYQECINKAQAVMRALQAAEEMQ